MGGVAKAVSGAASGIISGAKAVVGAVDNTVKSVVHEVGNVVHTATSAVEDLVSSVGNAVDSTVKSFESDPLAAVASVAAVATGQVYLLPMISATSTLAHGGSINQALTNAAVSYVAGQAGAAAGAEFTGTALQPAASGAAAGATGAALRGGDIETGALAGAINSAGNSYLNTAVNGTTSSGGQTSQDTSVYDPSAPQDYSVKADYGLHGTQPGLQGTAEQTTIPSDGSPIDYSLSVNQPNMNAIDTTTGTGLQQSDSANLNKMHGGQGLTGTDEGGTYGRLGFQSNEASPNLGDPDSFINDPEVLGKDVALTDTSWNIPLPKVNFAGLLGIGVPDLRGRQLGGLSGTSTGKNTPENYGSPQLIGGDSLAGDSTGDPYYLQRLRQIYGSLTPDMQKTLETNNGNQQASANMAGNQYDTGSPLQFASGGSADSSSTSDAFPQAKTGLSGGPLIGGGQRKVFQLTPLVQLNSQMAVRKAKGGLTALHPDIPKDHNPEFITGKTGYYANGRGTGQSDDIPAVLHHGDYVMDADTVAALGDGSSKAGALALEGFRKHIPVRASSGGKVIPAQIADGEYVLPEAFVTALGQGDNARGAKMLDQMRKQVREHKRSAPTSKIPPKAKSPLDYIKMGMKG